MKCEASHSCAKEFEGHCHSSKKCEFQEREYHKDDLKCCGNCKYLSLKYEGQCANDDIGTFADPNPEWVCESWEWDRLTKEKRK